VRGVSLDVRPGEILALVGPNGSGKSTLLGGLGGALRPARGRVELDGRPLSGIPKREVARRLGRLPQEPVHPEGLTVEALVRQGRHPHLGVVESFAAGHASAVEGALREMDLLDLRKRPLETLSGGERRRAWIAMVLAQEASVLLLDEPTAALDLRHQWQVLDLLVRLNRERGLTLVVSLHDLEQAARVAHRMAVMLRGRLYEASDPERMLQPEMLRDVFAIEADVTERAGRLKVDLLGPADPVRSL